MIDLLQLLNQRLVQMHEALGELSQTDLGSIKPTVEVTANTVRTEFSFGEKRTSLENKASLVIGNIGRLKDHFKKWLKANAKSGDISEAVLDQSAAGLIHDLWNVEKHVELRNPPRSGYEPKLVIRERGLVIGRGNATESEVRFVLDTWTGDFSIEKQGDACVRLNAEIQDEHGNTLGDFEEICIKAASEWLVAMRASGVRV